MTGYNKNYVAETVTDGLEESTDLVALLQKQEDQIAAMTSQLEGVRESLSQRWVSEVWGGAEFPYNKPTDRSFRAIGTYGYYIAIDSGCNVWAGVILSGTTVTWVKV